MLTDEDIRALGNITNTTWGRSSTTQVPTMSLKCNLVGDSGLQIKYTTVVTFASDLAMSQQMPTLESDAVQATNQYLKEVKKEFKKDVGRALKTKLTIATPSVEIISLQSHISPKRTAYYRYDTLFELS